MLEKLTIENFQCHTQLELDLAHPLVCIVGASDKGKSAVIRAFRWLATNQPRGDAFVQAGTSQVRITARLDGDKVVVREREGTENIYRYNGGEYRAFGMTVPEDIANALNLSHVNFAGQLDAPWFFLLSPSEVSRELNSVVNLDLIDKTTSNLATELRRTREAVRIGEERLAVVKERKENLQWVKEADAAYRVIEVLEEKIEREESNIEQLTALLSEIATLQTVLQTAEATIIPLQAVVAVGAKLLKTEKEITALEAALSGVQTWRKVIETNRQEIVELEKEIKKKSRGKCPVCGGTIKALS